jgi:hypothetical protein
MCKAVAASVTRPLRPLHVPEVCPEGSIAGPLREFVRAARPIPTACLTRHGTLGAPRSGGKARSHGGKPWHQSLTSLRSMRSHDWRALSSSSSPSTRVLHALSLPPGKPTVGERCGCSTRAALRRFCSDLPMLYQIWRYLRLILVTNLSPQCSKVACGAARSARRLATLCLPSLLSLRSRIACACCCRRRYDRSQRGCQSGCRCATYALGTPQNDPAQSRCALRAPIATDRSIAF